MTLLPVPRSESRTVNQKKNADGFPKAGELIEIRPESELSLHDRRVLNMLIENAGAQIAENRRHRISIRALRGARHNGSERVGNSIRRLMTTIVQIPTTDENGRPAVQETTLLAESTRTVDEDDPRGLVVYAFSEALREIVEHHGTLPVTGDLPTRYRRGARHDTAHAGIRRAAGAATGHQLRQPTTAFADPGLEGLLIGNGVEISAEPIQQGSWLSALLGFAPALAIIALYVWMFRRAAKQGSTPGRRTARHRPQQREALRPEAGGQGHLRGCGRHRRG